MAQSRLQPWVTGPSTGQVMPSAGNGGAWPQTACALPGNAAAPTVSATTDPHMINFRTASSVNLNRCMTASRCRISLLSHLTTLGIYHREDCLASANGVRMSCDSANSGKYFSGGWPG
jgi:hypothetical protein